MKINRFRVESLRHEEWFQFYTEFKKLVEQYDADELDIVALFMVFVGLYADADEAIEFIRKSATTEQIAQADTTRDRFITGLFSAYKSALDHYEQSMRDAAKKTSAIFDHYSKINRLGYEQQTGTIYNFIQDLNDKYPNEMNILNFKGWLDAIEDANKRFSELVDERYTEGAGKTYLRMVNVRVETDRCYRDMLDRLDALMLINGEEKYAPFVKELNTRTERFENLLAQRQGKNNAKKDKEDNG